MERGARLFYRFEHRRALSDLANTVDRCFASWGFRRRLQGSSSFFVQGLEGAPASTGVASARDLEAISASAFTTLGMLYESDNPLRKQTVTFPRDWISDAQTSGFCLMLENSDFWPEFLDVPHTKSPGVTLQENVHDYRFIKDLFCAVDADLCLGSHLGEFFSFNDPWADQVLRLTRSGPQKLVRPLEESRLPYRGYGPSPGPFDEFATDPATGLPKWAWIVNKPFRESAVALGTEAQ